MSLGVSYLSNAVKYDAYVDASGTYSSTHNLTWRCTDSMIFGGTKTWKNVTDPLVNVKWALGLVGHFDK